MGFLSLTRHMITVSTRRPKPEATSATVQTGSGGSVEVKGRNALKSNPRPARPGRHISPLPVART